MPRRRLTKDINCDIELWYKHWLKGKSLRAVARGTGMTHNMVQKAFQEKYGAKATDPVANSLLRSLLEDYEG